MRKSLPPLPEPRQLRHYLGPIPLEFDYYTAEQMREYAEAALADARALPDKWRALVSPLRTGSSEGFHVGLRDGYELCADALESVVGSAGGAP